MRASLVNANSASHQTSMQVVCQAPTGGQVKVTELSVTVSQAGSASQGSSQPTTPRNNYSRPSGAKPRGKKRAH
jgi:hypothetical protein